MGISGVEGVLMLPKGQTPAGSIKALKRLEVPICAIITFIYRWPR